VRNIYELCIDHIIAYATQCLSHPLERRRSIRATPLCGPLGFHDHSIDALKVFTVYQEDVGGY
jgi:hypothetical protein